MKKLYFLIFISTFTLFTFNVNATTITVVVSNNKFTPSSFNAFVGDSICWSFSTTTGHSTTSTAGTVPAGAAIWDSGVKVGPTATFGYKITIAGTYGYFCSVHSTSMFGTFTAAVVGIIEPNVNLLTSVYPNPFNDKVTIKYNGIESVEVFNVIGDKVKAMDLSASENKTEIDFAGFPAGIYFYRTYKEGTIVETRKIVKAN